MTEQCHWYFAGADGKSSIRCIMADGHDLAHRAYNGRWNAETQFVCRDPLCKGTHAHLHPATPTGSNTQEES